MICEQEQWDEDIQTEMLKLFMHTGMRTVVSPVVRDAVGQN